jgi:hypothetical protein
MISGGRNWLREHRHDERRIWGELKRLVEDNLLAIEVCL